MQGSHTFCKKPTKSPQALLLKKSLKSVRGRWVMHNNPKDLRTEGVCDTIPTTSGSPWAAPNCRISTPATSATLITSSHGCSLATFSVFLFCSTRGLHNASHVLPVNLIACSKL